MNLANLAPHHDVIGVSPRSVPRAGCLLLIRWYFGMRHCKEALFIVEHRWSPNSEHGLLSYLALSLQRQQQRIPFPVPSRIISYAPTLPK